MASTAHFDPSPDPTPVSLRPGELLDTYRQLTAGGDLAWITRCHDLQLLGSGGQGIVFIARREGADGFAVPISLKVFSPESYRTTQSYDEDMGRVAAVAARVATIQHQNLVYVFDFTSHEGVRIMGMEYVDGYDLRHVLTKNMFNRSRDHLAPAHWKYVNDVILTDGPAQPRLKPGIAIHILRDCLAGLSALHREGITHGDMKPSNVMLKRSGTAKVVDVGSAVDLQVAGGRRIWSPAYAAPEVLEGAAVTPQADLASLGYMLVEMLSGRPPFAGVEGIGGLQAAKHEFEHKLQAMLPDEVAGNELLVGLCRRLVAADPTRRFPDAEAADLGRRGAAAFHRQLVKGDLASEYGNDLRVWLEELGHSD